MSKKHWESYFEATKSQNWQKAINALNAVLDKEPKNPQVHLKIGDVFQKAGDITNAVAAYHQSAWLLMTQGFLQKALAIFKIILRLDPDNAEAINKSKELLMELESSRMKTYPSVPSVDLQVEPEGEKGIVTEPEQPFETGFEMENEQKLEVELPVTKMEDLLERTSYTKASSSAVPPKLQAWSEDIEIQPAAATEESVLHIPSFLSSVPVKEVKQLIGNIELQMFSSGQMILEEGDSGDSIFVIASGSARVVAHMLGKEIELAILSAGDVFGEVAFLTGRPRTASVVAVDEVKVLELNRFFLENIFEKHPEILKKLEDFYQSRVQDTLQKVKTRIKK